MTVVDTSFLVALFNTADRHHTTARTANLFKDRALVPWEILVEFFGVVGLRGRKDQVEKTFESFLSGPFYVDQVVSTPQAADISARLSALAHEMSTAGFGPLTIHDAIVCSLAARFKEPVLTFDRGMIHAIQSGLFPGARLA